VWNHTSEFVDLERQLEIMDASGIDAVVASPVLAGDVSALEVSDAREVALAFNEELARAQKEHPGRIYGAAVLPVQDAAAAVEALDDAIDRLALVGAILHSNINGASIADRELWPLYERAAERGAALFLHPTRTFSPARVNDYSLEPPLAYMFDTTIAAASLIVSGVLDAYPDLKIVHPHLGAALPYLVDRIDVYRRLGRWDTPRTIREYLPQFYTDTVSESPGGLRMALELYGADHLLFASDFPYFPAPDGVRFVADNVPPEHAEAIFSGNATELLNLEAAVAT
jgi:aminocarboxymuconate-semialdehyde decarboxylase